MSVLQLCKETHYQSIKIWLNWHFLKKTKGAGKSHSKRTECYILQILSSVLTQGSLKKLITKYPKKTSADVYRSEECKLMHLPDFTIIQSMSISTQTLRLKICSLTISLQYCILHNYVLPFDTCPVPVTSLIMPLVCRTTISIGFLNDSDWSLVPLLIYFCEDGPI